jgi:uncharacterized protein involved in outer membrane biogenesis
MKGFVSFILFIVLLAVAFFVLWSKAPDFAVRHLSKALNAPVSIGDMRLKPTLLTIDKFQIGNPQGYSSLPKAFSADTIRLSAPLTRYLQSHIVIEEVHLDGIYLGLEFDSISGATGNWTALMSHFSASQGSPHFSRKKTVLIKKLVFTNIATSLVFAKEKSSVKRLPTIDRMEFYNVSSEGGLSSDQLLNSVLGQMLKAVFQRENLKNMFKEILEDPQGTIDTTLKLFKGLSSDAHH